MGTSRHARTPSQPAQEMVPPCCPAAHPGLGLNVLPQQPLFVECVAGLARDGVYRALVDLLLDGAQEQEEWLPHGLLGWTRAVRG